MNGVVAMAELLCDTLLSEEQQLYAETNRTSGEALLVIINDVLDYSRIEAEKLTLHPAPFDLERCIYEVVMLLQPSARDKDVSLIIDFDLFLPTRYIGDPGRIRQVLINLIGNAVKFTARGHVLIRVVGFEAEDGAQQLHVTVEDTGIGIPEKYLNHIFGEFNQVEDQSNRKFEGTGLGLAITQQLINLMGGKIWVESEYGAGSCFGFRLNLPVAEDKSDLNAGPVAFHRALIVDDQLINRTILERQLATLGMTVLLSRSGAEAMALLGSDKAIDLVLTDQQLPDTNGMALAGRMRALGFAGPILLLSANRSQVRSGDGVTEILPKPILRSELRRKLQVLSRPLQAIVPDEPAAPEDRRVMRVLAAEDNRTNQLVFRKMVKDLDIDLSFANNGREAVELYQSFKPDMIFMDISMPEMDGCEATRCIRKLEVEKSWRRVPIVALTAHAMDGDADGILAAGLDHYLTKPLRKSAISERIVSLCPRDARPPRLNCDDDVLAEAV